MKNLVLLLMICLCAKSITAQNSLVTGKVLDTEDAPIFFSNVILHNAIDSAIVKLEYSNEEGAFEIHGLEEGQYFVEISFLGFETVNSSIFKLESDTTLDVGVFVLNQKTTQLEEITVRAKKPLLELKPDKLVLNVEGSINASGSDAFALLRQSPGVVIDNNDNIFMLGKSGLKIYIDNRPTHLDGSELTEYLKTIPSAEIESIEIITNPSARFEAEGNAGIINIRLRRDKSLGANASVTGNYSIGQKARYNGTIRGTYKSRKFNTYASVTGYKGENINPFNLYREQLGFVFDQHSVGEDNWEGYNSRVGMDYVINKKSTVGILFNGSRNKGNGIQQSNSDIFKKGANQIDSTLVASAKESRLRNDWNLNVNYRYADNSNRSLTIDLDYGIYNRDADQFQPNQYVLPNGTLLSSKDFYTFTPTQIDIITMKIDYEQPVLGGTFGVGFKLSDVVTDNIFDFYNVIDNKNVLDIERSNAFEYNEMVTAGYLSYAKQFEKLNFQAGMRVERTHSKGTLTAMVPSDNEIVERDYTDFFPSFGLSYQMNPKNNFQLNYSRRLNRPSYQDLNPFRNRLDELTFEQGNPFLNPEYTHSIQLSHSWNYKLNTSISFSHSEELITRITDTTEVTSAFITHLNLADQYAYSINVSAPIPINDWWNTYTSMTGVRTHNSADFGDGKIVDISVTTFNIYSQQSFNLPKGISMEISGWYNSPSIWGGTFRMDAMWSLSAGIQKQFLDDQLTIKLGVDDIFLSTNWSGTSDFGALFLNVNGREDSRRFKINMTYKFGNQQVKVKRRNAGLEDESNRIKGD